MFPLTFCSANLTREQWRTGGLYYHCSSSRGWLENIIFNFHANDDTSWNSVCCSNIDDGDKTVKSFTILEDKISVLIWLITI